jgi:hypothetical protein
MRKTSLAVQPAEAPLPRYYFDVVDRGELISDEDGLPFDNDQAALNAAASVFAEIAAEAGAGKTDRSVLFQIRAESGETVLEVTVPIAADQPVYS